MNGPGAGGSRCPFCGVALAVVHVHGHGQCGACGTNVAPCCSGASAATEADEPPAAAVLPAPDTFVRLFQDLGGIDATVTRACVLQELARRLGQTLDDARIVLDAGVDLGLLVAHGDTLRLAPRR